MILPSARKHGIADHDMIHAYSNSIRVFDSDDHLMVIGGDATGRLLEVGVTTDEDGTDVIIHAMVARPKFLR